MSRKSLQQQAEEEVKASIAKLQSQTLEELTALLDAPRENVIRSGRHKANGTVWAEQYTGKLAILVEVRESRLWGLWQSVIADGFYVHSDGRREKMTEVDLWDHGY